jgi:3-oxoacyl-[acyl-carrier protein] reductase
MDLGIKDKLALVAASSSGLGKAAARALSQEGAIVAVCSRSKEKIESAAAEIQAETGNTVLPFICDVTNHKSVQKMIDFLTIEYGGIDILVCNAGGPPAGKALSFDLSDYERAVQLNLLSTVRLCQAVIPQMERKHWGRIITVTSVSVKQPIDNLILSNTARAGVTGYLKTLSNIVAPFGITVNAVCPGYTKTDRVKNLASAYAADGKGAEADFYLQLEKDIPAKRLGDPDDLGKTVAFLASQTAGYITGISLQIDGGFIKGLF